MTAQSDKPDVFREACNFIKPFEGLRLVAYKCEAGVWTIGWGHTKGVKEGQTITRDKAEEFLMSDTKSFYDFVYQEVGLICNKNQIIALTSFAFNLGNKSLKDSTLLKAIKADPQNFTEIKKQFLRWDKLKKTVNGKTAYISSAGLKSRRNKEFNKYKS